MSAPTAPNPWAVKASSGGLSEAVKAGAYPAVLVALVDLGTHSEVFEEKEGKKKGQKTTKDIRKIQLVWELTGEPVAGKAANHVLGRDYNLAFSEKAALRKLCEQWRGKKYAEGEAFNLDVLLGKQCLITTTEQKSAKGSAYAKIENVGPLPKGMAAPPPKLKPAAYPLGAELPDWLPYIYGTSVPDFVAGCIEVRGKGRAAPAHDGETVADDPHPDDPHPESEIPF